MTDIRVETLHEIDWKDDPRRRDMFVAAALTGLLASWPPNSTMSLSVTGKQAVEFADATIAAIDATEAKP